MGKKREKSLEEIRGLRIGYFYLIVFVVLIFGGIITKRVFGHPEFMMMWHLPAAIFLVLGGFKVTERNRRLYRLKLRRK